MLGIPDTRQRAIQSSANALPATTVLATRPVRTGSPRDSRQIRGEGTHAHAIDGNGITSSEWAEWDQEDRETYLSGGYDQRCEGCDGTGKVRVVDEPTCPPHLLALYEEQQQSLAERKMGA